jgi:transcriptional regulator with XRE-family HTH domain
MRKTDLVDRFRSRIETLMRKSGLNLSRLAASAGIDRSALSEILSARTLRLPRAEALARLAAAQGVTVDWLLGLSEDEAVSASIASAYEIEATAPGNHQPLLAKWYGEASGARIRYVPSAMPDMLQTPEFRTRDAALQRGGDEAADAGEPIPVPASDMDLDIAMPRQTLEAFAAGAPPWDGFSPELRARQLAHMADALHAGYPATRLCLYDAAQRFSAPFTLFGARRAAVYVGGAYLVLNARDAIATLSKQFDALVRDAVVRDHEASDFCALMASRTTASFAGLPGAAPVFRAI